MALGPISTPRRPAPRSTGVPMIAISRICFLPGSLQCAGLTHCSGWPLALYHAQTRRQGDKKTRRGGDTVNTSPCLPLSLSSCHVLARRHLPLATQRVVLAALAGADLPVAGG